jgi:prevent-host-death family protein
MNKVVSAAEANRDFSKLLRTVREGETVVITSHGTTIAKLIPASPDDDRQEAAKRDLLAYLRAQPAMNAGTWTRDELYDD